MKTYIKNVNLLKKNYIYSKSMEHDACGVGLVASTDGKKSRKVVEFGIQALKAVWHRGAVDADGKTGDGAGIHIEIPKDFFVERIENAGRQHHEGTICIGMIFLPRNDYVSQEKCKTLVENVTPGGRTRGRHPFFGAAASGGPPGEEWERQTH